MMLMMMNVSFAFLARETLNNGWKNNDQLGKTATAVCMGTMLFKLARASTFFPKKFGRYPDI